MNASSYFISAVFVSAVFPIIACIAHWRLRRKLSPMGTLVCFVCYGIFAACYSVSVFAFAKKCGYCEHFSVPLSLVSFPCVSLPFFIFYALFLAAYSANANSLKIGVSCGDSERFLDRIGGRGASFPFGYVEFCGRENIAIGVNVFSFHRMIRKFSADSVLSAQECRVSFWRSIVLRFSSGTPKCIIIYPIWNFDEICQKLSQCGIFISGK